MYLGCLVLDVDLKAACGHRNCWAMLSMLFAVFVGVASLVFVHCSSTCTGKISVPEYDGLEALFTSTKGSAWKWNVKLPLSTRWSFPSNLSTPCSSMWQGVYCSYSGTGCIVTELSLSDYNLQGSIPRNIGNLSSIINFDCSKNRILGYIPTQFNQLVNLTKLDLSSNGLSGSIPSLFQSLTSIQLNSNSLIGSLPNELGQTSSMTQLTLYNNSLTGLLPTYLGQMTSLTELGLDSNSLIGSLPTELGQMISLTELTLYSNYLTGSLPTELGQLTSLTELALYSNCLTGSLPTELGQMKSLTELALYSNYLTGSLLTELGQMMSLTKLQLYINSLTGSLPTELGEMSSLTELALYCNCLTGSLPTELGQMKSLTQLDANNNSLTGLLPTYLGQITSLTRLDLDSNSLTGSLPTELGEIRCLSLMYLDSNFLTGSLPTELGQLVSMTQLDVYNNSLTGSLPTELGQMSSLTQLGLVRNSLTGSLPTELGNMTSLTQLDLYFNCLTGSLPTELGQMKSLNQLYLYSNSLTGSLPSELGQMISLTQLDLDSNSLTGSLPTELQYCTKLNSLTLFSNLLSYHIPIEIFWLKELRGLDLHCNYFFGSLPQNTTSLHFPLQSADMSMNLLTGSIPLLGNQLESYNMSFNLFDGGLGLLLNSSASLKQLALLDVSHNRLSGPLPSQWTSEAIPSLQTLLLSSNCFSSSISSSFAQIPNLKNLILDAYSSAPGCSVEVPSWLRWLVKGHFPKRIGNAYSLPWEIVQMPTLLTLHAAGNALTGSLPELITGGSIVDVSLANNNFEGTIPESWQTHGQFIQLDLSCNKLSGVLSSDLVAPFLSNSSVSNGSSVSTVYDLSVNRLSGNIPSSLYTTRGLNILDGNLFQCQETHMPEYDVNSKVTVCGSDTMNLSFYMWFGMSICMLSLCVLFRQWGFKSREILQRDGEVDFLFGIKLFCRVSVASAVFSILVLLTAYVAMKNYPLSGYSTHLHQYGWVITAAYLHGVLPCILVVISVVLASVTIYIVVCHQIAETVQHMRVTSQWMKLNYLNVGAMLLCHMVVTVTSNVLYVLAVLDGLPSSQLTAVQVTLGGFKLLWNSAFIGWSINRLSFLRTSDRLQLSSAMKIFTFLVSPYVATFFSDSTCFRYVITGSPVVSTSFSTEVFNCYADCDVLECKSECGMNEVSQIYTSTSPPWLYSYQCSSALLTNYIPVLVISYLISGLIIPTLVAAYSIQSQKFINSWLSTVVYERFLKYSVYDHYHCNFDAPTQENIAPLFSSYDVVSKLTLNLAVMLSFGFAAPLLAVIVTVDSCSTMYMWRLLINRFVLLNQINSSIDGLKVLSPLALARLESATADSFAGLHSCWLLALVSVAFFWSIFVFDMVGDVYGAEVGGLSVLGSSFCVLCLGLVPILLRRLRRKEINILSSESCNVEMKSVSPMAPSVVIDINTEMNSAYL